MLAAIIDTNIFVSGLLKGVTTRPIINAFKDDQFKLLISNEIEEELFEVLSRPKFNDYIDKKTIAELACLIRHKAKIVKPKVSVKECRDSKDNIILECALEGKPDFIVTNDEDLLVIRIFRGVKIISAIDFLKVLYQEF